VFKEDVQHMLVKVQSSTDHDHGPARVSNDEIMGFRVLHKYIASCDHLKYCMYYKGRPVPLRPLRAGGFGRENCWANSLTDRCASALTTLPLSVPLKPVRVGIDDEDEDVEEEASSSVRNFAFISLGSEVSTLRVAKGLAPSIEERRPLAVLYTAPEPEEYSIRCFTGDVDGQE
jgi:hypothetical protein